jgi:hypothetical protein
VTSDRRRQGGEGASASGHLEKIAARKSVRSHNARFGILDDCESRITHRESWIKNR